MTARPRLQQLPLSEIEVDPTLRVRDALPAGSALQASVARVGVLDPVVVHVTGADAAALLVHGFRRVAAAAACGLDRVPALVHAPGPPLLELLLWAVEHHAGEPLNLRERMRAVDVAEQLGAGEQQLARRLLPALGLDPGARVVRDLRRLRALPAELLDVAVNKRLSLRRCLPLCNLARDDAVTLARVAGELRLGARQLEEVSAALLEISRRDGVDVRALAMELGLLGGEAGAVRGADGAGPLERLERRRLPETTRRRDALDRLCGALGGRGLIVGYDRNFASDGLRVELSVRDGQQLERLLRRLEGREVRDGLRELLQQLER